MSIALMSLAWQTALPLNQKAALLAMADWANDDGASLHPSIYAIAERLTCSERTAQRLMKDLIADRWVAVVANAAGGRRGTTRHYRINVRKLREQAAIEEARRREEFAQRQAAEQQADLDPFGAEEEQTGVNLSPVEDAKETGDRSCMTGDKSGGTGDKSGSDGVTNQVVTGDTGVTLTTIEPSEEPKKTARKRATPPSGPPRPEGVGEQTWADWLKLRNTKRAPVTETVLAEAVREAGKAGLSLERFLQIWCARGSQGLQADWLKPQERGGAGSAPPAHKYAAAAATIYDGVFQ